MDPSDTTASKEKKGAQTEKNHLPLFDLQGKNAALKH